MDAGPTPAPPPGDAAVVEVLTHWSLDGPAAVVVAAAGAAYLAAAVAAHRRGSRWPARRTAAYVAGLAAVVTATQSGLGRYDEVLFSAHVAQHVLLGMLAPALLALGAPLTLALRTAPRRVARRLAVAARSRWAAVATHPLVAGTLFVASPFVLYFTPLYGLTLRSEVAHAAAHVALLAAGTLFLAPLLGRDPARWRLPPGARVLVLALTLPFHAFLGVALMSSAHPTLSASGLDDQRTGGALLWLTGDVVAVGLLGVAIARWIRTEERVAASEDAAVAEAAGR